MVLSLRDCGPVSVAYAACLGHEMPLQQQQHHALPPLLLQAMPPTNVPAADTERGELAFLSWKIDSNWNHYVLGLDSPAK